MNLAIDTEVKILNNNKELQGPGGGIGIRASLRC
jgi:hypothetical protein